MRRNIVFGMLALALACLSTLRPTHAGAQQPTGPQYLMFTLDTTPTVLPELGRAQTTLGVYRKETQESIRHTMWWLLDTNWAGDNMTQLVEVAQKVVLELEHTTPGWTYGIVAYEPSLGRLSCGPVDGETFISCLRALSFSGFPGTIHGNLTKGLLRTELALDELTAQSHEGAEFDVIVLFAQAQYDNILRFSETECAQQSNHDSAWCTSRRIRQHHNSIVGLVCNDCSGNVENITSGHWFRTKLGNNDAAGRIAGFELIPFDFQTLSINAEEERGLIDYASVSGEGGRCKGIPDHPRLTPYTNCTYPWSPVSFEPRSMSLAVSVRGCPGCSELVPQVRWDVELLDKDGIAIANYPVNPSAVYVQGPPKGRVFLPNTYNGCPFPTCLLP